MAYDPKNLSVLAYANGFTLWNYRTTDTANDVDTADYFLAAKDQLRVGDVILRQTFTSAAFTAISTAGFHIVNAVSGSSVDVTDPLALTVTDTR